MHKLWKDIASTSGARIYALLAGIISLSVTGRLLGPGGRGTIAAITTWVQLFSTFGFLSLGQVAIHRATTLRGRPWIGATLGSLLVLAAIITALGWCIAGVLFSAARTTVFKGLPGNLLLVGFLSLPFLVWEQYGSALLTAIDQVRIYNRAQILGRTVGIVLLLYLVALLHWRETGALIAILCAQVTVAIAGIGRLVREAGEAIRPDRATIRELVTNGLKLHLNAIGGFLFTSTDILVITRYRGLVETGYYQMAVQLMGILLIIPQAATMVLYSKTAQLGPDGVWPYQRKMLVPLTLGATGIGAFSAFAAPWILPLAIGSGFGPTVPIFQIMTLNLIGMTFSAIMASQWIGRGLFWQSALITAAVGVLNLVANCLLVPRYGMYGSVWATVGTYLLSVAANVAMALWVERRSSAAIHAAPQIGL